MAIVSGSISSSSLLAFSLTVGFLKNDDLNSKDSVTKNLTLFLPVIFLVIFIFGFFQGLAQVPWIIQGEIFPGEKIIHHNKID